MGHTASVLITEQTWTGNIRNTERREKSARKAEHSMNKETNLPNLPTLEISMFSYEDGSVGAKLDNTVDGDIWAKNQLILVRGITWLLDHLTKAEQERIKKGSTRGFLGNAIQAAWIEGEYVMRFMPVPGFGVSFKSEQNSVSWFGELLKIAMRAAKEGKE
jgi:hypothetical protein